MSSVAVIKYNAGNIRSVLFALERIGVAAAVTDDHDQIRAASHVIFPGVGASNSAMPYVRAHGLDQLILSLKQPFLGICLGMQLMCAHSEEGDTECLGIFDIPVRRFASPVPGTGQRLKIPHMGWNHVQSLKSPLMRGLSEGSYFYFVHSYYACTHEVTAAVSEYGIAFSAALQRDNFYGVQFHPEKSADAGELLLRNFLML